MLLNEPLDKGFPSPTTAEFGHNPAESFMPLDQIKSLTMAALAPRLDEHGFVKAVQYEAAMVRYPDGGCTINPELPGFERQDPIVLEDTQLDIPQPTGETIVYHASTSPINRTIYNSLTGRQGRALHLSTAAIERLEADNHHLEEAVRARPHYKIRLSDDQLLPAYHIGKRHKPEADIAQTRLYVRGGHAGAYITQAMLEEGADFSNAKVWTADRHKGAQDYREDCPIFVAYTLDELHSTLGALRRLRAENRLPIVNADTPLAGYEIPDLPGVYLGQTAENKSFNGAMEDLFAPAIKQAAQLIPLQTGEQVTDEWLGRVSAVARDIAHHNAASLGVSPDNHAFLEGQPIDRILAAIR